MTTCVQVRTFIPFVKCYATFIFLHFGSVPAIKNNLLYSLV